MTVEEEARALPGFVKECEDFSSSAESGREETIGQACILKAESCT